EEPHRVAAAICRANSPRRHVAARRYEREIRCKLGWSGGTESSARPLHGEASSPEVPLMYQASHPNDVLERYRASLQYIELLDAESERELAARWLEGDRRAGDRLVEASLPFVLRIAREYRRWGVPLDDLVQQGNLGLLKAAAKFDPDKNCRLVTYAAYWIRAEIRDYVVRS